MTFLPFQGISYIPSMIFTNGFSYHEALAAIGTQALWVAGLIIPIYFLWLLAKKQLVIQGG
jgi:ABC-2 type transport system permease protein